MELNGAGRTGQLWIWIIVLGVERPYTYLWSKDIGDTRRGGTCACSGTRAKCPSCSRCPCPGGARGRARRGRSCCCRSIADADHNQHEGRAAAIAARIGSAPCVSSGSERGRHRSARRCQLSAYP
eukprot:scaffold26486_cov118-Isochrysis_galbana.AAC.3